MITENKRYFAFALDPVHIGAGGYRLGRVDNTIVREPATDIPKIPGTSLSGAIREFTTIYLLEQDGECAAKNDPVEREECAREKAKKFFGDENHQGVLRFYDAQIIFFPVPSIYGPVWVTTKDLLAYWLGEEQQQEGRALSIPAETGAEVYLIRWDGEEKPDEINLGWLLLNVNKKSDNATMKIPVKSDLIRRIAVVSDNLFSHLVNDHLEVRTSVKINHKTGAAAEGALFTYEAIPRGTVLGFEIGIDSRREKDTNEVFGVIEKAFPYLKMLGIGGMGTRGFGRLEVLSSENSNK